MGSFIPVIHFTCKYVFCQAIVRNKMAISLLTVRVIVLLTLVFKSSAFIQSFNQSLSDSLCVGSSSCDASSFVASSCCKVRELKNLIANVVF